MRQNKLTPERRGCMEEIGFNMELKSEKNERTWNAKFQRLKKYKRKHGDCLVPINNGEDRELSTWVSHQRRGYKRGTIPNQHIQKLEEVGFVWSIVKNGPRAPSQKFELKWEKSFEKLREFYEVHGHFTIPGMLKNGKTNPITSWMGFQRKCYAQGLMKEDRRLKLEAIDFIWNQTTEHVSQRKWNAAFQDLAKFREEKGHTCAGKEDDIRLWRWTKKMKYQRKRSTLSLEREERLESIGFWESPSEKEDEKFMLSEDDDDGEPTAKRLRTTSISEEAEEELMSSDKADDRKPTTKRRGTMEKADDRKSTTKRRGNIDKTDDRKPTTKRRGTIEKADDRKPTAKRRRTTSTPEVEDEEVLWSSEDEDDDDRKPAAKMRTKSAGQVTPMMIVSRRQSDFEMHQPKLPKNAKEGHGLFSKSLFPKYSTGQR